MKTIIYAGVYFIISTTGQLLKFNAHFMIHILFGMKRGKIMNYVIFYWKQNTDCTVHFKNAVNIPLA
jgi:hypothetical protein